MTSGNISKLTFARTRFTTGEALTQTHRLDLLRRFVTDHNTDCGDGADAISSCRTRISMSLGFSDRVRSTSQPRTRINMK
jgi:hypothetical protein